MASGCAHAWMARARLEFHPSNSAELILGAPEHTHTTGGQVDVAAHMTCPHMQKSACGRANGLALGHDTLAARFTTKCRNMLTGEHLVRALHVAREAVRSPIQREAPIRERRVCLCLSSAHITCWVGADECGRGGACKESSPLANREVTRDTYRVTQGYRCVHARPGPEGVARLS